MRGLSEVLSSQRLFSVYQIERQRVKTAHLEFHAQRGKWATRARSLSALPRSVSGQQLGASEVRHSLSCLNSSGLGASATLAQPKFRRLPASSVHLADPQSQLSRFLIQLAALQLFTFPSTAPLEFEEA